MTSHVSARRCRVHHPPVFDPEQQRANPMGKHLARRFQHHPLTGFVGGWLSKMSDGEPRRIVNAASATRT